MQVPIRNEAGVRQTINQGLSDDERVWHFRSAWNVAALNCLDPQYEPILTGYKAFIGDNERTLKRINDRIDQAYRKREGSQRAALLTREEKMTRVYNFFTLPPARSGFCRTMLNIANLALAEPPKDAAEFALVNLPVIEVPFDNFFTDYEGYQRDSAAWDVKYGNRYGASQPGWVAVQEARANGVPVPSFELSDPVLTLAVPARSAGTVTDVETGASVPVIPVDENVISQPVIEPTAGNPGK